VHTSETKRSRQYLFVGVEAEARKEQEEEQQEGEDQSLVWVELGDALARFSAKEWLFDPHTLQLLRWLREAPLARDFIEHCNKQAAIKDPVGTIVDLEYSPNLFIAPIASNTLQPFTTTNLVVFRGKNSCLVVDPGASQAGRPHMEAVLRHLIPPPMPGNILVFLTHHHKDHCEALDLAHSLYPKVEFAASWISVDDLNCPLR